MNSFLTAWLLIAFTVFTSGCDNKPRQLNALRKQATEIRKSLESIDREVAMSDGQQLESALKANPEYQRAKLAEKVAELQKSGMSREKAIETARTMAALLAPVEESAGKSIAQSNAVLNQELLTAKAAALRELAEIEIKIQALEKTRE